MHADQNTSPRPCSQHTCGEDAEFKYEWPGAGVIYACGPHKDKAVATARALGMEINPVPLEK